jgi:site-specific recombinase XerD
MNCLSEPVAPYKNFTYPQPLGRYVAEFEQTHVRRRLSRKMPQTFSKSLWEFFSRFPTRKDPRHFYVTDVEDYKQVRLDAGYAWNTVRKELCLVRTFFNWLAREAGLELTNPVIQMEPRALQGRSRRTAWDLSRRSGRTSRDQATRSSALQPSA